MLEVTPAATDQLRDYFKGREIEPIRIFLNEGGCCGASLALALDQPKDTDERIAVEDFTYLVDKQFLETIQPVKVDFNQWGFQLSCAVDFTQSGDGGCSGCGTTSKCCSSH